MSTVWWVNHSDSYDRVRQGGYISAPKNTGQPSSLEELIFGPPRVGDATIHFAEGAIRSVGILRDSARIEDRPSELPEGGWLEQRLVTKIEYYDLGSPIDLTDIPARESDAGPFDRTAAVKPCHLYALSPQFAATLYQSFRDPARRHSDQIMSQMSVIRSPQGTNFSLSSQE
jgi:hypothetical protein